MLFSPAAHFDALAIVVRLRDLLGSAAIAEVHLFSYLACLLSLYRRWPATDWGYGFAVTRNGYPFSAELHNAIRRLRLGGHLKSETSRTADYVVPTEEGEREYSILAQLGTMQEREPFHEGACESLLALPVGTIRVALSNGIDLHNARSLHQKRLLLTEWSQTVLYEQFSALSATIGVHVDDLMVPSVLWLTYLAGVVDESNVDEPSQLQTPD